MPTRRGVISLIVDVVSADSRPGGYSERPPVEKRTIFVPPGECERMQIKRVTYYKSTVNTNSEQFGMLFWGKMRGTVWVYNWVGVKGRQNRFVRYEWIKLWYSFREAKRKANSQWNPTAQENIVLPEIPFNLINNVLLSAVKVIAPSRDIEISYQ